MICLFFITPTFPVVDVDGCASNQAFSSHIYAFLVFNIKNENINCSYDDEKMVTFGVTIKIFKSCIKNINHAKNGTFNRVFLYVNYSNTKHPK